MQLQRTRVTPEARLVLAAAVLALVALLLAQGWRDLLDVPAQPPSPALDAPATLPARTAPAPLLSAPPDEVTTAPQPTAAPMVAPADAPSSIAPSTPPTLSPPQVGPGDAGNPNFLAPADGEPPAVPAKVPPPPKG